MMMIIIIIIIIVIIIIVFCLTWVSTCGTPAAKTGTSQGYTVICYSCNNSLILLLQL